MRLKWLTIMSLVVVGLLGFAATSFSQDADPAMASKQSAQTENISGAFDLERCVERALEKNPSMVAIRAQLQGARFGTRSSFGDFLPSASVGYGYTHNGRKSVVTGKNDNWAASATVTQPIFQGFNLLATWQKAKLNEEYNEASLSNVELTLVKNVQSNFLSLLKAREDVKSAEDSVARLESQLKVITAFFEVGLRPKAEVLDAEVDLATAKQGLLKAQNQLSIQETQLNTLLNIPLEVAVDYVGALKHIPFGLTLQECLSRAYEARPDLMIGKKSVEMAEKDVTIATSNFFPKVDGSWSYNNNGVDAGLGRGTVYPYTSKEYWSAGVSASMSVFEGGSDYYARKQAQETVRQLEAQLEDTRLNAGFEVKQALLNIKEASDRITVAQKSVAAAEEAYRMAVARYQAQVGTNTDVLNAQSRLTDSEAQLSQALADHGTAISALYVAMGEKNMGLQQAQ